MQVFLKVSELFDKTRKIEARVSADEDLKLSDLLKYYLRESQAAKDLLYRRSRSLVDYENANKALDKARAKIKMFYRPKLPNNYVVRNLKKSLSLQNKNL